MRNWKFPDCVRGQRLSQLWRKRQVYIIWDVSESQVDTHFLSASLKISKPFSKDASPEVAWAIYFPNGQMWAKKGNNSSKNEGGEVVVKTDRHRGRMLRPGKEGCWSVRMSVSGPGTARQVSQADSHPWSLLHLMGFLWLSHLFYRHLKYDIWFHLYETLGKAKLI